MRADEGFEKEGPQAGQIDYHANFFLRYIPAEVHVHALVYPRWEACAAKFEAMGGDKLDYRRFRDLCRQLPVAQPLAASYVEFLIDVLGADGEHDSGIVTLRDFKMRYARDEAVVMEAVRANWVALLAALDAARAPGAPERLLPRPVFANALLRAVEAGLLGAVSKGQALALGAALKRDFLTDKGEVKYDTWVQARRPSPTRPHPRPASTPLFSPARVARAGWLGRARA